MNRKQTDIRRPIIILLAFLLVLSFSGAFSVAADKEETKDPLQKESVGMSGDEYAKEELEADSSGERQERNDYIFEDERVEITAAISGDNAFPDEVSFECSEIAKKSKAYRSIVEKISDYFGVSEEALNIMPYDVCFRLDGNEIEPENGSVILNFEMKEPVRVKKTESVSVVHINNEGEPEIIAENEDIVQNSRINDFEVELDSLSPIVLVRANAGETALKSVRISDGESEYYISKTFNIADDGTKVSNYTNNMSVNDVVYVPGAESLDISIEYGGESTAYDWVCMWQGDHYDYTAYNNYSSSLTGKLGGTHGKKTYHVNDDTVTFAFRSDGSGVGDGFGYYAVITPQFKDNVDVPLYHFEELEDGTYALVFDRGGDIQAFSSRSDIAESIADYKNRISEIRLHKDTTQILDGAFMNLPALKSVTVPRNPQLQTIGKNTFKGCDSLEKIEIPATVTSIDSTAFRGCTGLETVRFADANRMTELPAGLFRNLTALKSVILPLGLTKIPDSLFEGCTSLETVNLPDGITEIGSSAFRNTVITDIPISDSVTKIGDNAFSGCTKLTNVYIPANVKYLGQRAFENCTGVTDFEFDEDASFSTLPIYLFSGMTDLRNVKLPGDLSRIPDYCFNGCSKLQKVSIPDTVTTIGNYSFSGCSNLKDFEIPSQVTGIGTYAFQNCTSLKDMEIPKTVKSVGKGLFKGCKNLIRVIFEEGSPVSALPSEMFYGCSNLETVKLPDNVTSIPSSYFRDCVSLKQVDLPVDLISIGDYAFYNCYNMRDFILPDTLKTIGSYSFYNCDRLTEITIPDSVTSIGSYAWKSCDNIRSVEWQPGSRITSLNYNIFQSCKNLETLILPSGLTKVPDYLCDDCTKLNNVMIPSNVTIIGSGAFKSCTALDSINIPAGCTNIYGYAFHNSGLSSVDLPASLGSIGTYAFSGAKLNSVTIPNQVTSVGDYAFYSNSNLESVIFQPGGKTCSIGNYAFYGDSALDTLQLKEEIKSIGNYAFANDRRLTEFTIPSNVTSIGSYAFSGDTGIKRLVIPSSPTNALLNIDSNNSGNTFYKLNNVEEIVIDRDITSAYTNINNFNDINPDAEFTIGNHVNTLDNMIVSLFNAKTKVVFEGENDFKISTRIDNTSEDAKWSEFQGSFYADSSGVVYKLNDDSNTASVFHIPEDISAYTVPETVTSVAGKTYRVNMIEAHAVRDADGLTALTVDAPQNVKLPQFSLSDCSSLLTVNGKNEIFENEWMEVSLLCGFPVHTDKEMEQVLLITDTMELGPAEGEGKPPTFSFSVIASGQENMGGDNNLNYVYATGSSARLDFAISNESNFDMTDRVIRIYFAFDGDNYDMGKYKPGQEYTLKNTSTGAEYPFTVGKTDAKGVYYYDITGFRPGDTVAFNNSFLYNSPKSAGGTMQVWAESLTSTQASQMEGKVSQPGKYILAEWYTAPTPYNITKAVYGNPTFQFVSNMSDENDNSIYVKNMRYSISMNSQGASGTTNAADYIKYVDFSDDLQLNNNMIWNPAFITAVKNGDYYVDTNNYLYAKLSGRWVEICHFSFNNNNFVRSITPVVVNDNNGNEAIRLKWSYRNQYWNDSRTAPTADLPALNQYVYLSERAIQVKRGSDLWRMLREGAEFSVEESESMRRINNKVTETTHYSFSDPQTKSAEANERLIYLTTGFNMKKSMTGFNKFGLEHAYTIDLNNTGLIDKDDIDHVEDPLREHYYIEAGDLESMFKDSKWGDFLNIDITSATLCSLPQITAVDVQGHNIDGFTAQQSGIDPIPYSGCASSDSSEIVTNAKLSLRWNNDRNLIILEVKSDSGELQNTYTIGEGGDYTSVQDAMDDIGYVVTYRAAYKVTWDLGDRYTLYNAQKNGVTASSINDLTEEQKVQYHYKLRSGRTDSFHISSRVKNTAMWLTKDEIGAYPLSSNSSNNTAYAKDKDNKQLGSASWNGTLYRELSLSKSASVNGVTYTSNQDIHIPDDTVIDYTLSFSNSGGRYDVLPLTDKMKGTQVLLVPVRNNRYALFCPEGADPVNTKTLESSGLETYTDDGIAYYILSQAGTYKGVTIDGRKSDTIKVSRRNGYAETLTVWYYRDVTGYSANTQNGVTRNITYKALENSTLLGANASQGHDHDNNHLDNEAWLGGHQTHRLYASLAIESEMLQFEKWIVDDPENESEKLTRHTLIQNGNEVLYKIIIKNTGDSEVVLNGSRIHDELPCTKGIFPWSKDNVKEITYVTKNGSKELGSSVEKTGKEYWDISSIQPNSGADTASRGYYYIYWNNDFSIDFEPQGEIWIYVRLQFPGSQSGGSHTDDKWDDYIAANGGNILTNYFDIDQRKSSVTHELVDFTEGKLQKGVLDTGLSRTGYFQSEDTRQFYQNGGNTDNGSVQEVAYYTVLYNSGNVRLYLDKLEDQLPKGFKFRGLINAIPKAAQNYSGFNTACSTWSYNTLGSYYNGFNTLDYTEYFGSNNESNMPVAFVSDGEKTVSYMNAKVTAETSMDSDGHQQIDFTLGRYTTGDKYLKYDSSLGKYYLDPNEAIRFGYICIVEGYARTESFADNEISMPVYDKYGMGVDVSGDKVKITPAVYRDIPCNDGGCDLTTTEEETAGHMHHKQDWVRSTTEWFSSNVSLRRLSSVPGVQKTVGGETYLGDTEIKPDNIYGPKYTDANKGGTAYTGTVAMSSIVNWRIRAYNEGGLGSNSMEDYWVEDTVEAPYRFTGNFFYDYYSAKGAKMTSESVPVFSLGGRSENDTVVRISTGQGGNTLALDSTITVNESPVAVDGGRAYVQLLRDKDTGDETLRIHFNDNHHRIPPNAYMELYEHTQYVSNVSELSKQFFNHVELRPVTDFDPEMVSQGKVLYKDEDDELKPYAIESGASVTMTAGYSTAARKQVSQLDNSMQITDNTAWSDRSKNSIILPDKYSKFCYDLYIDLPKDDPTSKFVLIDALPEPGDHSPFVERDSRDSEFIVRMLSENPGFTVSTAKNAGTGGKKILGYDEYNFEVSTKVVFVADDWEGIGNGEGWKTIDLNNITEDDKRLLKNARSFRVTISDPDVIQHMDAAIMGKNAQIQVGFNAELQSPDDTDPGQIAWNSFGYRYTVPIGATGILNTLNAEPLKVGVQIPSVPYVNKAQKTPHGHYLPKETESKYEFLIYTGSSIEALNDVSGMTREEIADVLTANGREMLVTSAVVNGGSATGRTDFLDEEKKWVYDTDLRDFGSTTENWIWINGSKYTIIELPWEENGYVFSSTQNSPVNNYTFTQNAEKNIALRVVNEWNEKGSIKLSKTVQGPSCDANRKFTFTIHLQDGKYPAYGTYDYIGTNIRDGSLSFDDSGNASIQLKHGQSIELKDIPAGYTYSVTESEDQLYSAEHSENNTGSIEKNVRKDISFTNTRKSTSLSVAKSVDGRNAETDKLFDFDIEIKDEGRNLEGEYAALIKHADKTETSTPLLFSDGVALFQLKDGDTLTINGLPVGARYEVTEIAESRVNYDYTVSNESGTIGGDDPQDPKCIVVNYTNTRKTTSLSVSKSVEGAFGDKNEYFDFSIHVTDSDASSDEVNDSSKEEHGGINGKYDAELSPGDKTPSIIFNDGKASFRLKDGEKLVIKGLPVGAKYTVEETNANKDGYETVERKPESTTLSTNPGENVIRYTNKREQNYNPPVPTGRAGTKAAILCLMLILSLCYGYIYRKRKKLKR